jgi:hypothetical protein
MATNNTQFIQSIYPQKRLGDKTLFNTATKKGNTEVRYFSGIDAEIYFGETYIDETVQIEFTVQQNTMPLYGYNSYVYDQIAQGSRIIQGQFTINFTKASYLYDVLNTLAEVKSGSSMNVVADKENTISEQYVSASTKSSQISISDNSPMWNKAFEICMSYGDYKSIGAANSTMILLKGVWITGVNQNFGINGEPIYETYSFIARDMQFAPMLSSSSNNKTTNEEDVITINEITYSEAYDGSEAYGTITVSYKHHATIEKVLFEPNIPGCKLRGLLEISTKDNANSGLVSYRISNTWREAIRDYHIKDKKDVFNSTLSFSYKTSDNKSTATKPMTAEVKIKAVINC